MPTDHDLPALAETPPGLYRHYKGGQYLVLATARHSETLEPMTVYRALYGERGLWVRPAGMFCEEVTIDGVRQPRFTRIGDAPAQEDEPPSGIGADNSR
jgi:hypothetical protein